MSILSDQETVEIQAFNQNKVLKEAVRKVLLTGIYENGVMQSGEAHDPTQNFALTQVFKAIMAGAPISNEELGENLRAAAKGIQMIEEAFAQLEKYQPAKVVKKKEPRNV